MDFFERLVMQFTTFFNFCLKYPVYPLPDYPPPPHTHTHTHTNPVYTPPPPPFTPPPVFLPAYTTPPHPPPPPPGIVTPSLCYSHPLPQFTPSQFTPRLVEEGVWTLTTDGGQSEG